MTELAANFARVVSENPYPGRGLVVGRDPKGDWLQVYWIMGRSAGSRNRVFVADGTTLATRPADAGQGTGDARWGEIGFQALLRRLDREDPSYRQ